MVDASSPTGKRKQFLKKMSVEYQDRGLQEVCVDNEQVAALHTENNRERRVNESHQQDIKMIRDQLARSEEVRAVQNAEILEQQKKIKAIHQNYQEQLGHMQDLSDK